MLSNINMIEGFIFTIYGYEVDSLVLASGIFIGAVVFMILSFLATRIFGNRQYEEPEESVEDDKKERIRKLLNETKFEEVIDVGN